MSIVCRVLSLPLETKDLVTLYNAYDYSQCFSTSVSPSKGSAKSNRETGTKVHCGQRTRLLGCLNV